MNKPSDIATPISLGKVTVKGGFWGPRIDTNRRITLPIEYQQLQKTGRIDAWKLDWRPGKPNKPHFFWDSDVAKWIEAAAYSLITHPDEDLERLVDEVVGMIEAAQQPDGYLNIYYTVIEPEHRWQNLRDWHELYCAGHLIEAAVAYYEATSSDKLLQVMRRYADYIDQVFGPGEQQIRGYPGHQEIELALVRLYRVTGERRYLSLAQFFIDERGQRPHFFEIEKQMRLENGITTDADWERKVGNHAYSQAHLPVRVQNEAVGHAVRACYLYAGMADIAAETDDRSLVDACQRLWKNVTAKQMYITGGIGATQANEGFTFDYDLPDETAHAETCAAIALILWASRMLHLQPDSDYADVLERALYNGVLSGVSLDGSQFFYANPLAAFPRVDPNSESGKLLGGVPQNGGYYRRRDWFDCACCPPNICRLIASLGQYIYSTDADTLYIHLYTSSLARFTAAHGITANVMQDTDYPFGETISLRLETPEPHTFTLALRIPGWCRSPDVRISGERVALESHLANGYAYIRRRWQPGEFVEIYLPMPVERIRSHPAVRQHAGQVALQRGPIVYCLEEVDNGPSLHNIALPWDAEISTEYRADLLDGVIVLTATATRSVEADFGDNLYRQVDVEPGREDAQITAIPYFAWGNRQPGEMRVWIPTD